MGEEVEEIRELSVRATLLLLGLAFMFVGTLLIALGSVEPGGEGGSFVVIGPFFLAFGRGTEASLIGLLAFLSLLVFLGMAWIMWRALTRFSG